MNYKSRIVISLLLVMGLFIIGCEDDPIDEHNEVFTVTLAKYQNDVAVDTVAVNVETKLIFLVMEGEGADAEVVAGLNPTGEMEMMGMSGHTPMDVHDEDNMTGHYEIHNTFTAAGTYECHFSFDHDGTIVEEQFEIIAE